jgi:hypothetical protein
MKTTIQPTANPAFPLLAVYSTCFSAYETKAPFIQESIFGLNTHNLLASFSIKHSCHSFSRARSRGISTSDIMMALDYGEVNFKQGLLFYIVKNKNLPFSLDKHIAERLKNLVVVISDKTNEIVTCYKSKYANKNIRKKSKTLWN